MILADAYSLTTFLATLSWIFRSGAALQLACLCATKSACFSGPQESARSAGTACSRSVCSAGWRSALAIVRPEAVIAWHRAGFRLFWTWKVRRGTPGRHVFLYKDNSLPWCGHNWSQEIPGQLVQIRKAHRHGVEIQAAVIESAAETKQKTA